MTKLFRLATPADYSFHTDIGLWELSFDKRPIKGVRCEDPIAGAYEYNQGRIKFREALQCSHKLEQQFDFNAVLEWAAQSGSPEQCHIILGMLCASNIETYKTLALKFIQTHHDNYPMHLDIAIFFTGFNSRLTTKHDLINIVKRRAEYGKDN